MRRFSVAVAAATLIVSIVQGGMPAAHAGGGGAVYYLALGDSLAAGYQPGRPGIHQGYVDDLWRSARQQIPGLGLRNVGCRGETARSMITGVHSPCHYVAGSQLDAAVAFLEAHPGQVSFITIDIGANDLLNACIDRTGLIDEGCTQDLLPRIQSRSSQIFDALATAGPGVPIVAMTYYDPFLGFGPGRSAAGARRPAGVGGVRCRTRDGVRGCRGHRRRRGVDLPDR
jgi:lysophospholipase L1-like esterase